MTIRRRHYLRWLGSAAPLAGVIGCVGSDNSSPVTDEDTEDDHTMNDETESTDNDRADTDRLPERSPMSQVLIDLIEAVERETFAQEHDLEYDDGLIKVQIEVATDAVPPDSYLVEIVSKSDYIVHAWVAIDDLVDLALTEQVDFIRPEPDFQPE